MKGNKMKGKDLSKLVANREVLLERILTAVSTNSHIVACLDYGSASEGRADALSDLDLALFIKDEAVEEFQANWQQWAAQFGDLLLAYIGGVGHPWVVYANEPLPLRVDFNFIAASQADIVLQWPNAPTSVKAMLLYDDGSTAIRSHVAQLVGQSLAPPDTQQLFTQVCGDFWYYLLRTHVKFLRGGYWEARHDFNFIIVGNLLALLRIESNSTERLRGASAAAGLEQAISPERLKQLDVAKLGSDDADVLRGLGETAVFGQTICRAIHQQTGWPWPDTLAQQIINILIASTERKPTHYAPAPPPNPQTTIRPLFADTPCAQGSQ